jgi:hypothetical protein
MPAVQNIGLVALLLEEVLPPGCVIEGVRFTDSSLRDSNLTSDNTIPTFLKQYEQIAWAKVHDKHSVAVHDGLINQDSNKQNLTSEGRVQNKVDR